MAKAQMHKIRLEQALAKGEPPPVAGEGYEFYAPLDGDNHIDAEAWKEHRSECFVHRLENGVTVERGLLVHAPGGAGGATWIFDYDYEKEGDEEAGFKFGSHAFAPGEYVSIRDPDGDLRTYRITAVSKV